MDTSSGNYSPNLIGTAFTAVRPSFDNPSTPSASFIPSTGLARYHSAPSSVLASLLETDLFTQSHGPDLVQYLAHGGLAECTSVGTGRLSLKPTDKEQPSFAASQGHNLEDYPIHNDMTRRQRSPYIVATASSSHFQEHVGQGPLTAILEHGGEDTMVSRPIQQSPREQGPMLAPSADFSSLLPVKSSLIRHSSLPTDFVSRLLTDDVSEGPLTRHVGAHVKGDDNTGGKVFLLTSNISPRAVPIRKGYVEANSNGEADVCKITSDELKHGGLLRQGSSPAGMLSQLSLDEAPIRSEKINVCSSAMGRLSVQGLVHGTGVSEWDEDAMDVAMQKIAALGQRKRVRDAEARLYKGVPTADIPQVGSMDSPSNLYPAVGAGNAEGFLTDSVLCKSRAKRGCATHPRSIAERVRRTKISDRIKKLQDLVPNLDKQAHMADMLDEVVEYVKLLQKQVQELSKHAPECNGMCQQKVENRES